MAVQELPALSGACMDDELVKKTLKFTNTNFYGHVTPLDIFKLLKIHKVYATDVETLARGPGDKEVTVVFKKKECINILRSVDSLKVDEKTLKMSCCGNQTIYVRVHWLPIFTTEECLREILGMFGKVVEVREEVHMYSGVPVKTGIRAVKMELTETERINFPHLLKFECGTNVLLTYPGRPPICLKCHEVGHYRNQCHGNEKNDYYYKLKESFSGMRHRNETHDEEEDIPETTQQNSESVQSQPKTTETTPSTADTKPSEEKRPTEEEDMMQEEESRGRKRQPDEEENKVDDSFKEFFPRQKSRRPSVKTSSVEVSNSFSMLAEEDSSPELEPPAEAGTLDAIMDGLLDLQR